MAISETVLTGALGVIALAFLCCFWFLPGGVLALRRIAHGEMQVDLRPGYGPDTLYQMLELYGPEGLHMFRKMLTADMFFPLAYGSFLYLLGDLVSASHPAARGVPALAIFAAAFDYSENIFLFYVLRHLPKRRVFAARAAGVSTTLKLLSFVGIAGMLAIALRHRR